MKRIEQTIAIKAPIDKVWQAFVDPVLIEQWGGGPVVMDDKEGSKFSLWGGDIHGKNTTVFPQKLLAQDWFSGKWHQPSKLTFTFATKGDETIVKMVHEQIPDDDAISIEEGWKDYYLGPLKDLVES